MEWIKKVDELAKSITDGYVETGSKIILCNPAWHDLRSCGNYMHLTFLSAKHYILATF
jgi:hypothetical protein